MLNKRTPHQFSMADTLDLRRLRELRKRLQLTQAEVGRGMGLSGGEYGALERGVVYMRLYQFRQICILLGIGPLEICELLRLPILNRKDISNFRAACKRLNVLPIQALSDFLKTFIRLSKEES